MLILLEKPHPVQICVSRQMIPLGGHLINADWLLCYSLFRGEGDWQDSREAFMRWPLIQCPRELFQCA